MRVGAVVVDLKVPVVMTILNVTPDSFYKGSRRGSDAEIECAVVQALEQGAGIIDVGGYSSRPGAADVDAKEEFERVARGVAAVRRISAGAVVSIDTFRGDVAGRILDRFGECIINDISAGELDPSILDVVAAAKVPYIAMHMRADPATMQQHLQYEDVTTDVMAYFRQKLELLHEHGIDNVIIDPGFGFAKSTRQNYQLLRDLSQFAEFEVPVLAGLSRKSMIYKVLETTPEDALVGTTALHWQALLGGASVLRVHDTRAAVEVVKLFNYYTHDGE